MASRMRKRFAKPEHYPELNQVVTLAEAARMVYIAPNTLRLAIDTGRVAAIPCGRIWLVSVRSLLEEYPVQNIA